ncbi:MAG: serine/threonine-protein kinase [Xanthomonadales bacterium]|nr:serine/threonine-protein kinase [Xanthomonadales bacterium]
MSRIDPQKSLIDRIFTAALELSGPEREAFLEQQCQGTSGVRSAVEGLLKAAEESEDGLADPFNSIRNDLFRSMASDQASEEDLSGQRFSSWLLVEPIARGGLATVYLARRDDGEFDQTVAFKVLRRGLDTDDLIARFRAERQILSTLEHPAIVQILDGGALPDGRPYLVLEYVDGSTITDHCRTGGLALEACVGLVTEVLDALHHAHQRLVVHRDIKPSNILVSRKGKVALLDFGIAKLLDDSVMGGSTPRTRTGVALLTPGYGSPEQKSGQAVTTASDIYQVGLVLYEMITGRRREQEQSGPASRYVDDSRRRARVRGDLDAILAQALHEDPNARYASASAMRDDLQRFLAGQPVAARPDTLGYRLSKLIRRRPWLLPSTVAALLAVAAYVLTLTSYNYRLQQEQIRATAAQDFMVELLRSPDPFAPADPNRGQQITVLEAIDLGLERVHRQLADQPEIRATLLASIATIYQSLGQHDQAIALREEALLLEQTIHGEKSPQVLESTRFLASEFATIGQVDRADELYRRQLALASEMFADDAPAMGVAEAAMGNHLSNLGRLDEGADLLAAGVEKIRDGGSEFARPFVDAVVNLVSTRLMRTPSQQLVAMLTEARDLSEQLYGSNSLSSANIRSQLASTLSALKDHQGAEENFQAAIAIYDETLGRGHEATLATLNNFALHYQRTGRAADSEGLLRDVLGRTIALHGEVHEGVARSYQNLATAMTRQRRFDEAIPLHWKAQDLYKTLHGDDHYYVAFPLLSIAYGEFHRQRPHAAESAAEEAVRILRLSNLAGSSIEGIGVCLLARARQSAGNDTAEALMDSAHALMRPGPVNPVYLEFCGLSVE